jgi:hypothetical protein
LHRVETRNRFQRQRVEALHDGEAALLAERSVQETVQQAGVALLPGSLCEQRVEVASYDLRRWTSRHEIREARCERQ